MSTEVQIWIDRWAAECEENAKLRKRAEASEFEVERARTLVATEATFESLVAEKNAYKEALACILNFPIPQLDDMMSANMRQIARDALVMSSS